MVKSSNKPKKSTLLDRVKEHFDTKSVRTIEVAEWGDDDGPLIIYVSPMTLLQRQKIYGSNAGAIDFKVMVAAVILKAEDQDGDRLFNLTDKSHLLNHADDVIIAKIAGFILDVPEEDDEEISKN